MCRNVMKRMSETARTPVTNPSRSHSAERSVRRIHRNYGAGAIGGWVEKSQVGRRPLFRFVTKPFKTRCLVATDFRIGLCVKRVVARVPRAEGVFHSSAAGGQPAIFHTQHAIGDVQHAAVVGHHQNRTAVRPRQLAQQVDHVATGLAVERSGRFVRQKSVSGGWPRRARSPPAASGPPTGGPGDSPTGPQTDFREQFGRTGTRFGGGDFRVQLEHEFHIAPRRQKFEQIVLLKDESDCRAARPRDRG